MVSAGGRDMSNEPDSAPITSEQKMRLALEARRGTPFTDEEWDEAKRNLVGMFLMMGLEDSSGPEN
jgi:hypothetical protein